MTPNGDAFETPAPAAGETGGVDLSAFDSEYEAAEAPDFDEVPDGKYQVTVKTARLGESSKGDPMLKWDLVIISGQFAGRHIFKNAVITAASLPFVKGDLKTLGVTLPKFSELPSHLPGLLDTKLQVTKRTKDEFTNVYFNKVLDIPAGEAASDEPAPF
ncbi:MAG: hypothetical protein BIFFINMI_02823 [Phycisphaerae bacterium]|nr:hypothetical protein [Phycisphaerae bacterium]